MFIVQASGHLRKTSAAKALRVDYFILSLFLYLHPEKVVKHPIPGVMPLKDFTTVARSMVY
jgi:hypothetical protein